MRPQGWVVAIVLVTIAAILAYAVGMTLLLLP